MTAPKPMTKWQASLPEILPLHIRRNVTRGPGGCWLWNRSTSPDGYGWASLNNVTHQAHRLVYTITTGAVAPGLVLDHLCRVRRCVNPAHLEPVTPAENLRRSELTAAGVKKCVKGHELSSYHGQRRCLVCKREYERSRRRGLDWESRQPWSRAKAEA